MKFSNNLLNNKIITTIIAWLLILLSIVMSYSFFNWSYNVSYNKIEIEQRGHRYFAAKKYQQAFDDFYRVAVLSDDAKQKSLNYRYAATAAYASLNFQQASSMAISALQYNQANMEARSLLKTMLKHKQVKKDKIKHINLDK